MKKLLLILFSFYCLWGQAQNEGSWIFKVHVEKGRVLLRWMHPDNALLKEASSSGFILRKIYKDQNKQVIKRDTIFFRSKKDWLDKTDRSYTFDVAQHLIFSEWERKDIPELDQIQVQRNLEGLKMLYADLDIEVAAFQGLAKIDNEILDNTVYHYRLNRLGREKWKEDLVISIRSSEITENKEVSAISKKEGDRVVELYWNHHEVSSDYVAYWIEKSFDGGKEFERVNRTPFIPLVSNTGMDKIHVARYRDSLEYNTEEIIYRIQGINYFGQLGKSSENIIVKGRHSPVNTSAEINKVVEWEEERFMIEWNFNTEFKDSVSHFFVLRSIDEKQTYQRISEEIHLDQRVWYDEDPQVVNFYKIVLVDIFGNEIESIPVLGQLCDNDPPLAPRGLKGRIDSSGIVYLNWDKNTEEDLGGYHVFYGNSAKGEFTKLSNARKILDSFYTDTIYTNTLAENIFYKLQAIDFRGNQSEFSEVLKLKRPDFSPPTPAVIKYFEQKEDSVSFHFMNSSSKDLKMSYLERRTGNNPWQLLDQSNERMQMISYTDRDMDCQKEYSYRIRSLDFAGNTTFSEVLELRCIDSGKRKAINPLIITLSEKKHSVSIQWDYHTTVGVKEIILYRSEENKPLQKHAQLWKNQIGEGPHWEMIDDSIPSNSKLKYKVVMRFQDGGFAMSEISNTLNIP